MKKIFERAGHAHISRWLNSDPTRNGAPGSQSHASGAPSIKLHSVVFSTILEWYCPLLSMEKSNHCLIGRKKKKKHQVYLYLLHSISFSRVLEWYFQSRRKVKPLSCRKEGIKSGLFSFVTFSIFQYSTCKRLSTIKHKVKSLSWKTGKKIRATYVSRQKVWNSSE